MVKYISFGHFTVDAGRALLSSMPTSGRTLLFFPCSTTLRRLPTLGGKELDVYHLYQKVESLGGYDVVSQGRMWGEVARSFGLPPSVTSASYAIRQHYIRYGLVCPSKGRC